MARRSVIVLLTVWLAALAVVIYWIQDLQIGRLQYARPYRDTLALPQVVDRDRPDVPANEEELPQLAEIMPLGYKEMVASILWLRVIQAFGGRLQHIRENPKELHAIENVFSVITLLDPHFIEAYKFGSFVIGDEGGDDKAALRLIDAGIVHNYKRAHALPYDAIFICLQKLKEYKKALYYVHEALKCRDCPDYVARIGNYITAKKGDYEIALERWVRDDLNAAARNDKFVLGIARTQINQLLNEWNYSILNAAIDRYFERHHDYPARLDQLQPEDLVGKVRQVEGPRLVQILDAAEKNKMPANETIDLIMGTKDRPGCIVETNRVPLDLRGQPYLLIDAEVSPVQKRPTLAERQAKRLQTEGSLFAIRRRMKMYYDEKRQYPAALSDLPEMKPGATERLMTEDPAGMPWKYDPKTGAVGSYVFPEL